MESQRVGHDWATSLSLFTFKALEKEMATHSSVLTWRIPGTAEPGGLPSMGSHRFRHDWSNLEAAAAAEAVVLSSLTWETNTCLCSLSYKTQMKTTTQHIFDLWNIRFQSSSIPISTLQYPAIELFFNKMGKQLVTSVHKKIIKSSMGLPLSSC